MAWDPEKEKIIVEKETQLADDILAVAKVYTYNDGPKKFKLVFKLKTSSSEFFTAKIPALVEKGQVAELCKLMKEVAKEL